VDEATNKPSGTIQYEIYRTGKDEKLLDFTEDITSVKGASAQQVTIEKLLPLTSLEPGKYTLKVKVTDNISKQSVMPTATFTVTS